MIYDYRLNDYNGDVLLETITGDNLILTVVPQVYP
jgi:hypothetical protein